jgi:hypothetical protein
MLALNHFRSVALAADIGAEKVEVRQNLLLHRTLSRVTTLVGPAICRRFVVGWLRTEVQRDLPDNVLSPETRHALQILQSHCRLCGRCRLSQE